MLLLARISARFSAFSWLCTRAVAILPTANAAVMRTSAAASCFAGSAVVADRADPVASRLCCVSTERHHTRENDRG
jgi:hypothetical protein